MKLKNKKALKPVLGGRFFTITDDLIISVDSGGKDQIIEVRDKIKEYEDMKEILKADK